jgi:hypothetical protein
MPPLPAAQVIASAAKFLIEGGDEDAASVVLACNGRWEEGDSFTYDSTCWSLVLRCPRAAYDILSDVRNVHTGQVARAVDAVMGPEFWRAAVVVRAELQPIDQDWRDELLEIARGRAVHNQAAADNRVRLWNSLRFRSLTETRIAEALDAAGVLYLPNCIARISGPSGRVNREPDFLVCKDGRWGILEVDGEEFHPPSRTTQDHERDRLFKAYGVRVVEHFDATDCYTTPKQVVSKFLAILDRAYA